jgi:hypothetical protein
MLSWSGLVDEDQLAGVEFRLLTARFGARWEAILFAGAERLFSASG